MPFILLIVYARCLRTEKKVKKVLFLYMPLKRCRGVEVIAPLVCTLALDGGGWSVSCSGSLMSRKQLQVPLNMDFLGPGAGLDILEKREMCCPC